MQINNSFSNHSNYTRSRHSTEMCTLWNSLNRNCCASSTVHTSIEWIRTHDTRQMHQSNITTPSRLTLTADLVVRPPHRIQVKCVTPPLRHRSEHMVVQFDVPTRTNTNLCVCVTRSAFIDCVPSTHEHTNTHEHGAIVKIRRFVYCRHRRNARLWASECVRVFDCVCLRPHILLCVLAAVLCSVEHWHLSVPVRIKR